LSIKIIIKVLNKVKNDANGCSLALFVIFEFLASPDVFMRSIFSYFCIFRLLGLQEPFINGVFMCAILMLAKMDLKEAEEDSLCFCRLIESANLMKRTIFR
jgi:hypothetical protein